MQNKKNYPFRSFVDCKFERDMRKIAALTKALDNFQDCYQKINPEWQKRIEDDIGVNIKAFYQNTKNSIEKLSKIELNKRF